MYKKRLAKWSIHKNTPRSAAGARKLSARGKSDLAHGCRGGMPNRESTPNQATIIFRGPDASQRDRLTFNLLATVQAWSTTFFDSMQQQPTAATQDARNVSHAFDLVGELLKRGQGGLAGRVARRAFLLVEKMLLLDAPALVWNLLEAMHKLVAMNQTQLLKVMLAHSIALINHQRQPTTHPLHIILGALKSLVGSSAQSKPQRNHRLQLPLGQAVNIATSTFPTDHAIDTQREISFLLEQAFIANASVLFDRFDPAYSQLYFNMVWDACSLNLPMSIMSHWLNSNAGAESERQPPNMSWLDRRAPSKSIFDTEPEDILHQRLLVPRLDAAPPPNFSILRATSIAALRDRGRSILSEPELLTSDGKKGRLPRAVASLLSIQFLGNSSLSNSTTPNPIAMAATRTENVAQIDAAQVACIMRTVMDIDVATMQGAQAKSGGLSPIDIVNQTRVIAALRAYAHGESNPIVIHEIWLLQDALVKAGQHAEAEAVSRDAYRRLDKYLEQIPVNTS